MKFSILLLLVACCAAIASSNTIKRLDHVQHKIRAGEVPVRGVNLGGWLVTECWINPEDEMWNGVPKEVCNGGEYVSMQYLGHTEGDARYEKHHDTYITEADIEELASFKLNTVRVPIGYWIVGFDNHDPSNQEEWKVFAPGGLKYLDRLINEWAPKYNVAVLVDIHAAKGSQNGMDHSAPPVPGTSYWSNYPENIENTIDVAAFLAERYRNSDAFLGIELLNEPHNGVTSDKLRDYYLRAYDAVRSTGNDCILVVSPLLTEQGPGPTWDTFMRPPRYINVWHDWHKYLLWGFEDQSAEWIMTEGVALISNDIAQWTGNPLIMGEWSLGSSDNLIGKWTDEMLTDYAQNMFDAMAPMEAGWTMWTWKQGNGQRGDGEGGWCMRDFLRDGIMDPSMWE